MKSEIIATGDEIRTGALVDSNTAYIAQWLEQEGLEVVRHTSVGDDMGQLQTIFAEIGTRADICLVTGGLGPTQDDLTREAAAAAAGVDLVQDDAALANVEAFFKRLNRTMSRSNRKQARLPAGSTILANPMGTAPGFALKMGRCTFFCVPGVPHEMRTMLTEQVAPHLNALRGGDSARSMVRTLSLFGLPESTAGERVAGLPERFPQLKVGLRAKFPEIQIKLYGRSSDPERLQHTFDEATAWVQDRIGNHLFTKAGESMPAVVGRLLRAEKATLAIAESCTGGLIAHWVTNVSGSSDYLLLSAVTYANSAKIDVLGVKPETIESRGAVDIETVRQMAVGARKKAGASYGLATSGIAGPTGGTDDKPVGTVCIGLSGPRGDWGRRFLFPLGGRTMKKKIFAMAALDQLRREMLGMLPHPQEIHTDTINTYGYKLNPTPNPK